MSLSKDVDNVLNVSVSKESQQKVPKIWPDLL